MTQGRPAIPTALSRAVLVEAGHRCAIPTCRQVPVELAHIRPWAIAKEHTFDNLIALCPTCHARFDSGQIDKLSMRQYKANLDVLNHRYTDTERQLLKAFVQRLQLMNEKLAGQGFTALHPEDPSLVGFGNLRIYAEMWWTVSNLLDDGLIEFHEEKLKVLQEQELQRNAKIVLLTQKGREFLDAWVTAAPL